MRPLTVLASLAVATIAAAGPAAFASSPPDTGPGADEALAAFEELATAQHVALVDPACVATTVAESFTCYAATPAGDLFVASVAGLGSGRPTWQILQRPADSGLAPSSTGEPAGGEANAGETVPPSVPEARFDALSFFAAVFSADADTLSGQDRWVQPGSPAAAYLDFQRLSLAAYSAAGTELLRGYVYQTPDSIRVCLDDGRCSEVTDLVVEHEQLVSFSVDGHAIAARLSRSAGPFSVGPAAVGLHVAYRPVTSESLVVVLEVATSGDATADLETATYVAPDGTQAALDLTSSANLGGAGPMLLVFPGAALGGELRFVVHPADGSTPLAAIVPVVPFEASPTGDTIGDPTTAPATTAATAS